MEDLFTQHTTINYPDDNHRTKGLCLAYGFEPPTSASSELGNVFVLFDQQSSESSTLHDDLLKIAGKEFYEPGLAVSFSKRFEKLLKAYNAFLSQSDSATTHMNACILASQRHTMHFSSIGNPLMVMFRGGKLVSMSDKDNASHKFSEVVSFKLQEDDRILLGSHSLAVQTTKAELSRLLLDTTFENFSVVLTKRLQEAPKELAFAAVLIESNATPTKLSIQPDKSKEDEPAPTKQSSLQKVHSKLKKSGSDVARAVGKSGGITKNKVVPSVARKIKQGWTSLWARYINPYPKKAIIVVVVSTLIIILLIVGFSTFFGDRNQITNKLDQTSLLLDQAQKDITNNNSSAAQGTLAKANQILASISKQDQEKLAKAKLDTLSQNQIRYQKLSDELTDTVRVSTSSSFPIDNRTLGSLVFLQNTLYGIDTKVGQIVEINPIRKSLPVLAQSDALTQLTSVAASYTGDSMTILAAGKLFTYGTSGGLQELKGTSIPASVAVSSYLNNVYLLSPTSNQVVRYVKTGTNLTNRAEILKNLSADTLKNASSFVVSGNIFVSSGTQILLFENGTQRDFTISGLPQSFGNIAQIQLNTKQESFLVLNQDRTRIALLSNSSNSAEFKRQFAIGDNEKIESFTAAADGSEVFVFAGGKLVTFTTGQ